MPTLQSEPDLSPFFVEFVVFSPFLRESPILFDLFLSFSFSTSRDWLSTSSSPGNDAILMLSHPAPLFPPWCFFEL